MHPEPPVILRPASRVLVLDQDDRMLMFFANVGYSVEPQRRPDALGFWALPGGGVDAGESHEAAAIRELREETGLIAPGPMPCIAHRDATYPWKGKRYRSIERYFVLRTGVTSLDTSGWQEGDKRWMTDLGWWELSRLTATNDIVRPPGLIPLVADIIAGRMPSEPVVLPA